MINFQEIREAFESLRDDDTAKKMTAYMRGQFKYYGIPTPARRKLYKDMLRAEKRGKNIDWRLLDACWADEYREFQYFAMDYLDSMQQFLTYDDIPRIEGYARTRQWWDTIDGLNMIIGEIGLADSRVSNLMLEWSHDEDFWIRRIAIDHQLCRKGKTDTELLERILVNNFGSKEFFINKAIGWSLRDYSKTNPEWVRRFIEKYRERMNSLSIREASKYI